MGGIAQGLERRGAEILVDKTIRGGRTVIFKGDVATLGAMSIGVAEAWKTMIADNDPGDGSDLYVRLTLRDTGNGEVHMMTPAQVTRHLSNT